MSGNLTFKTVLEEYPELPEEIYDHQAYHAYYVFLSYFEMCYLILLIVIGVPSNILALMILIRRRLWRNNEAYVYLTAVLIINTIRLILLYGNTWLHQLDRYLLTPSISSDIACKSWVWAHHVITCNRWLHVLMLLSVFLRQQLNMSSSVRRGCYMSVAVKYCTLFGAKVVIGSFFTVFALASFWYFLVSGLQHYNNYYGATMLSCHGSPDYFRYMLHMASLWIMTDIPLFVVIALLFLVVCKRKRSSRFVFSQVDGASQDSEEVTRIVIGSSIALIVICVPYFAINGFGWYLQMSPRMNIIREVTMLISMFEPLSTPVICFAVKFTFREELKAMVLRCCPGKKWHSTLPPELDSRPNSSSVLQMVDIEDDPPGTGREENS